MSFSVEQIKQVHCACASSSRCPLWKNRVSPSTTDENPKTTDDKSGHLRDEIIDPLFDSMTTNRFSCEITKNANNTLFSNSSSVPTVARYIPSFMRRANDVERETSPSSSLTGSPSPPSASSHLLFFASSPQINRNRNALHVAAFAGNANFFKKLFGKNGQNATASPSQTRHVFSSEITAHVNQQDADGNTVLHLACLGMAAAIAAISNTTTTAALFLDDKLSSSPSDVLRTSVEDYVDTIHMLLAKGSANRVVLNYKRQTALHILLSASAGVQRREEQEEEEGKEGNQNCLNAAGTRPLDYLAVGSAILHAVRLLLLFDAGSSCDKHCYCCCFQNASPTTATPPTTQCCCLKRHNFQFATDQNNTKHQDLLSMIIPGQPLLSEAVELARADKEAYSKGREGGKHDDDEGRPTEDGDNRSPSSSSSSSPTSSASIMLAWVQLWTPDCEGQFPLHVALLAASTSLDASSPSSSALRTAAAMIAISHLVLAYMAAFIPSQIAKRITGSSNTQSSAAKGRSGDVDNGVSMRAAIENNKTLKNRLASEGGKERFCDISVCIPSTHVFSSFSPRGLSVIVIAVLLGGPSSFSTPTHSSTPEMISSVLTIEILVRILADEKWHQEERAKKISGTLSTASPLSTRAAVCYPLLLIAVKAALDSRRVAIDSLLMSSSSSSSPSSSLQYANTSELIENFEKSFLNSSEYKVIRTLLALSSASPANLVSDEGKDNASAESTQQQASPSPPRSGVVFDYSDASLLQDDDGDSHGDVAHKNDVMSREGGKRINRGATNGSDNNDDMTKEKTNIKTLLHLVCRSIPQAGIDPFSPQRYSASRELDELVKALHQTLLFHDDKGNEGNEVEKNERTSAHFDFEFIKVNLANAKASFLHLIGLQHVLVAELLLSDGTCGGVDGNRHESEEGEAKNGHCVNCPSPTKAEEFVQPTPPVSPLYELIKYSTSVHAGQIGKAANAKEELLFALRPLFRQNLEEEVENKNKRRENQHNASASSASSTLLPLRNYLTAVGRSGSANRFRRNVVEKLFNQMWPESGLGHFLWTKIKEKAQQVEAARLSAEAPMLSVIDNAIVIRQNRSHQKNAFDLMLFLNHRLSNYFGTVVDLTKANACRTMTNGYNEEGGGDEASDLLKNLANAIVGVEKCIVFSSACSPPAASVVSPSLTPGRIAHDIYQASQLSSLLQCRSVQTDALQRYKNIIQLCLSHPSNPPCIVRTSAGGELWRGGPLTWLAVHESNSPLRNHSASNPPPLPFVNAQHYSQSLALVHQFSECHHKMRLWCCSEGTRVGLPIPTAAATAGSDSNGVATHHLTTAFADPLLGTALAIDCSGKGDESAPLCGMSRGHHLRRRLFPCEQLMLALLSRGAERDSSIQLALKMGHGTALLALAAHGADFDKSVKDNANHSTTKKGHKNFPTKEVSGFDIRKKMTPSSSTTIPFYNCECLACRLSVTKKAKLLADMNSTLEFVSSHCDTIAITKTNDGAFFSALWRLFQCERLAHLPPEPRIGTTQVHGKSLTPQPTDLFQRESDVHTHAASEKQTGNDTSGAVDNNENDCSDFEDDFV